MRKGMWPAVAVVLVVAVGGIIFAVSGGDDDTRKNALASSGELVANGGFEDTSAWLPNAGAARKTTGPAHSGTGSMQLGGSTEYAGSIVRQDIAVPAGDGPVNLSFWLNVTTAETATTAVDPLTVQVRDPSGYIRGNVAQYSNLDRTAAGTYVQKSGFDLSSYRGQTITIFFKADRDTSNATLFRIDDVSVNAGGAAASPPVLSVAPTSLSFAGTAFQSTATAKQLSINNTGGGTLNWRATGTQPWLSISPASGTQPGAATVSVKATNQAAGTYKDEITIEATGATPVKIPVTFTVSGSATADRVSNGAFEGSATPWTMKGTAAWISGSADAHAGSGHLALTESASSATGSAGQAITVPGTATTADLSLWLKVTTSEVSGKAKTRSDQLFVNVYDTAGTKLATLASYSNLDASTAYVQRGPISLLAYKGKTVNLRLETTTNNASLPTTFRVDDVSVR